MIINFLEVSHTPIKRITPKFVGMYAVLTILDDANVEPDEVVQISSLTHNKRTTSSYTSMVVKMDLAIFDRVEAFISTASLKLEIGLIGLDGTRYRTNEDFLPISDYRVDSGALNKSLTFVSRVFVSDVIGSNITITKYSSKSKKVDGSVTTYTYSLDPLISRYIGVGKTITEGGVVSTVTSKSLNMSAINATLNITSEEVV